jgi:hypothetical protein
MTKDKKIAWRLKELPTGGEVAELVEAGVLTKDEAREIIIKETDKQDDSELIEALKKQIKFLEDLVKEQARNNTPVVIDRWVRHYDYTPRLIYANSGMMSTSGTTTLTSGMNTVNGGSMNLTSYAGKLLDN